MKKFLLLILFNSFVAYSSGSLRDLATKSVMNNDENVQKLISYLVSIKEEYTKAAKQGKFEYNFWCSCRELEDGKTLCSKFKENKKYINHQLQKLTGEKTIEFTCEDVIADFFASIGYDGKVTW